MRTSIIVLSALIAVSASAANARGQCIGTLTPPAPEAVGPTFTASFTGLKPNQAHLSVTNYALFPGGPQPSTPFYNGSADANGNLSTPVNLLVGGDYELRVYDTHPNGHIYCTIDYSSQ